jgi:hypothetical protein
MIHIILFLFIRARIIEDAFPSGRIGGIGSRRQWGITQQLPVPVVATTTTITTKTTIICATTRIAATGRMIFQHYVNLGWRM